jgi:hypothetical protein
MTGIYLLRVLPCVGQSDPVLGTLRLRELTLSGRAGSNPVSDLFYSDH